MRLPRLTPLKNIAWACLALLVLASGIETGLRIYDYQTGSITAAETSNFGLVTPSWTMHHELKPLHRIKIRRDGQDAVVLGTNSFGVRGNEPQQPKHPDTFRILCLGDEMVFAKEVANEQSLSGRLQTILGQQTGADIEVINAGVPGYCPLLACLQFRRELLALQPDLVIYHFDMTDVDDDRQLRRHVLTDTDDHPKACPHPSLIREEKLRSNGNLTDHFLTFRFLQQSLLEPLTTGSDSFDLEHQFGKYAWLADSPPDWSIYIKHAMEPIDQIEHLATSANSEFILATYPAPWQVSATATNSAEARRRAGIPQDMKFHSRLPFELLADHAHSKNLKFCDASSRFDSIADPDALYLNDAPQFSAAGHDLYAGVLAEFILKNLNKTIGRRNIESVPPPRAVLRFEP